MSRLSQDLICLKYSLLTVYICIGPTVLLVQGCIKILFIISNIYRVILLLLPTYNCRGCARLIHIELWICNCIC